MILIEHFGLHDLFLWWLNGVEKCGYEDVYMKEREYGGSLIPFLSLIDGLDEDTWI